MIAEIKLRAERRAGELLAEMEKDAGGRPPKNSGQPDRSFSEYKQAVKSANLSESRAERWQSVAAIPEEFFEQHLIETRESKEELTSAGHFTPPVIFKKFLRH